MKKDELINLINSIENKKAISYLLGFVKDFCNHYLYFVDKKWIRPGEE